jgi:diacylglycerol kinase family enzyme
MGGDAAGAARRGWARAALVALLVMVGGLVLVAVGSDGGLFTLVVGAVLGLAVVAATGWWAFTTRRVWKRRLNVAVAALVVASVLLDLVVVGLQGAAGVLVLAAGVLGYGATARRALGRMAAPPGSRPAHPPTRPWLLVNPRSGGGKAERLGVAAAARARGMQVHELAPGDDPAALARQAVAAGADAVGVAGGDGSLGLVAAVAVEADVPFVCVPSGTRNHFAADLGLDRTDPLAALDAFAGPERRIDVGVVGDRMFMNNVSLGAYAELVAEPGYRAGKLTTAHAVLPGALRGERALLQVAFQDPEGRRYQDVLVLLVANNGYELHGGAVLGARERLDAGILQISALRARTGAELAGLVARIAARRARPGAEWAQWTTATLRVDAAPADLPAGIDGEAVTLAPPLEFRVLPLALRVLLPTALRPRAAQVGLRSWATVRRLWVVALSRGRAAPAHAAERRGGSRRSRER